MRIIFILLISIFFSLSSLGDNTNTAGEKKKTDMPAPVFNKSQAIKGVSGAALQFRPMTTVTIKRRPLVDFKNLRPIKPAEKPVKPEGPDPAASLDLSDYIDDASLLDDLSHVCGWESHLILQDIAAPHVFYYIPREFLLKQDESGYRLSVQYNTLSEQGKPSVMITAELQAPYRSGDSAILKSILQQAFDLKPGDPLEIKAMPGLGATADLNALSTGLTVPPERINLTPPSHLKQEFRLTMNLTQDETEEVLAQITGDGLAGSLNVKVKETHIPVPIRISYSQFTGERLEGFYAWATGKPIDSLKNLTSFPVNIESINGYRLSGGKLERISKKLKPVDIRPGKTKPFKLPSVKELLGDNLAVIWMGLSLDSGCTDCIRQIDLSVRKGIGVAPGSKIHLEAIPSIFEEFGLYKLIVHIQSPYLTAGGKSVKEQEAIITADANINADTMIFVPSDKGENPLLYKYRLEAVMDTGESNISPVWEESRKLTQFFGASQLEKLIQRPDLEPSTEE
ncbi:MAG: hypothetical protein JW927_19200 [Deltaproteobacteria bacterium]|nr:hypothetical protein [Deltaproteobacteria bacterium]